MKNQSKVENYKIN